MRPTDWSALTERLGQHWRRSRQGAGHLEVRLLEPRLAFENAYIRVYNDRVEIDRTGQRPFYLRLTYGAGIADGAVIVAVTEDDCVLLVRQFRHAMRLWMVELPRGFARPGERNHQTAVRELPEETGYRIDFGSLIPLGRVAPDSGKLHDAPHIYLCRALPTGMPAEYTDPRSTEPIANVFKVPFSLLAELCERGEILDMFTLAAVMRAGPHFAGDRLCVDHSLLADSPMLSSPDALTYEDGSDQPTDIPRETR